MILLVILAGSIVRSTQSGMGCPDWPRCYGLLIPPVNESQLPPDYQHLYANHGIPAEKFDAVKTWTEYINRLLGALLGFTVLLQAGASFRIRKEQKIKFYLSLLVVFLTGFQAWLGALVVSSNLAPVKITVHMAAAMILLVIAVYNSYDKAFRKVETVDIKTLSPILLASIGLLFVQIILGTQVREEIDEIAKAMDYQQRWIWVDNLSSIFKMHRSFSILLAALLFWLIYQLYGKSKSDTQLRLLTLLLGYSLIAEILAGLILANLGVPAYAQPVHLLAASVMLTLLARIYLICRGR
jgi:cytochrome c oxidase assembly protein subunit 15